MVETIMAAAGGIFLLFGIVYIAWNGRKNINASKKAAHHYFDAISKILGNPYPPFIINDTDMAFLRDHNYNPDAIYHLVVLIMMHLKAPYSQFNIRVSDGKQGNVAGLYSQNSGLPTIEILVKPNFTEEQVIAIVCHECMHHYLNIKKIKGKSDEANEKLTDYAAVYTGFGKQLQRGYKQIQNNFNGRELQSKIGYLSEMDIRIAIKTLKRYVQ